MTPHHTPIFDAEGDVIDEPPERRRGVGVKQMVFDWSGVVGVAMAAMAWATMAGDIRQTQRDIADLKVLSDPMVVAQVKLNSRTIERLQLTNESFGAWQQKIAETMATREDVDRLSGELRALAIEIRTRR